MILKKQTGGRQKEKMFIISILIILAISSHTIYSKSQNNAKAEDKTLYLSEKKERNKKKAADKKSKIGKGCCRKER